MPPLSKMAVPGLDDEKNPSLKNGETRKPTEKKLVIELTQGFDPPKNPSTRKGHRFRSRLHRLDAPSRAGAALRRGTGAGGRGGKGAISREVGLPKRKGWKSSCDPQDLVILEGFFGGICKQILFVANSSNRFAEFGNLICKS